VCRELGPVGDLAELIGPERQRPLLRGGRVLLSDGARRSVAGIDVGLLAGGFHRLIERGERRQPHVGLAAHLDNRWRRVGQGVWNVRNRAHRVCDVLPRRAVAARGRPNELTVLVANRQREPIELELAREGGDRRVVAEATFEAFGPAAKLIEIEGVVERHHRHLVHDRGKRTRNGTADLLSRRVGDGKLGVLLLEGPELVDHAVEVGVGQLRRVELVVEPHVVGDLLTQLGDPNFWRILCHTAMLSLGCVGTF